MTAFQGMVRYWKDVFKWVQVKECYKRFIISLRFNCLLVANFLLRKKFHNKIILKIKGPYCVYLSFQLLQVRENSDITSTFYLSLFVCLSSLQEANCNASDALINVIGHFQINFLSSNNNKLVYSSFYQVQTKRCANTHTLSLSLFISHIHTRSLSLTHPNIWANITVLWIS